MCVEQREGRREQEVIRTGKSSARMLELTEYDGKVLNWGYCNLS